MMNDVVLFDLDGTLTPPRERITSENVEKIIALLKYVRVGIVTGSTISYVIEQVNSDLFSMGLEVFPCNGTEHWRFQNAGWTMLSEPISMRDYLGSEWRHMHKVLHDMQGDMMEIIPEMPLTGQFVSYRGSMVNWCPIGREAGAADRKIFEEIDAKSNIRNGALVTLRDRLKVLTKKLTVKLGGSTSFDIYPAGWDKSYVLRRFPVERVWFVGDRCGPTGNDYEIYEALRKGETSYNVSGPDESPQIVNEIMMQLGVYGDESYCPPY